MSADLYTVLAARVPLPLPEQSTCPAHRVVLGALSNWWRPAPPVDIEKWCRENLKLTGGMSSDAAGSPVEFDNVPHARLILDFLRDPVAEKCFIKKSSAAGFSTTTIAALICLIKHEPANVLYLISDKQEAKNVSRKIWRPFLRQVFGTQIIDNPRQSDALFQVNGIEVHIGAPSEETLRNKQFKHIVVDESDTMSDTLRGGGGDLETSLDERTKNAGKRKIIELCAPLYAWNPARAKEVQAHTRIDRLWQSGDRREFRVPCPSCGLEECLSESQFHYSQCRLVTGDGYDLDRLLSEVVWKCPACARVVEDGSDARRAMIRAGRWVPTIKAPSRLIWSAHYTDWNALIGSTTWGRIVYNLESARGSAKWAAVRRSHLGEAENRSSEVKGRSPEMILRHCSTYRRGECPVVPLWLGMAVDAQRDTEMENATGVDQMRFPWMIGAIAREPRNALYVIDWGEETDLEAIFSRAVSGARSGVFSRGIPFTVSPSSFQRFYPGKEPPAKVFPKIGLIDSGFYARGLRNSNEGAANESQSIYAFCERSFNPREGKRGRFEWLPVKGRAGVQTVGRGTVEETSADFRGRKLPLYFFDDWFFKSDLHARLADDPARPSLLSRNRPRILFPRASDTDCGDGMIDHLCAENLEKVEEKDKYNRVTEKTIWKKRGANDWWDTLKILSVLAESGQLTERQAA